MIGGVIIFKTGRSVRQVQHANIHPTGILLMNFVSRRLDEGRGREVDQDCDRDDSGAREGYR